MKEYTLTDISYNVNRIKMDDEWYLRVGPNCWYLEVESDFCFISYLDVVEIEKKYQKRKKQNEPN